MILSVSVFCFLVVLPAYAYDDSDYFNNWEDALAVDEPTETEMQTVCPPKVTNGGFRRRKSGKCKCRRRAPGSIFSIDDSDDFDKQYTCDATLVVGGKYGYLRYLKNIQTCEEHRTKAIAKLCVCGTEEGKRHLCGRGANTVLTGQTEYCFGGKCTKDPAPLESKLAHDLKHTEKKLAHALKHTEKKIAKRLAQIRQLKRRESKLGRLAQLHRFKRAMKAKHI